MAIILWIAAVRFWNTIEATTILSHFKKKLANVAGTHLVLDTLKYWRGWKYIGFKILSPF